MYQTNYFFGLIFINLLSFDIIRTFDSFMDNVYYGINWVGPEQQLNDDAFREDNSIVVTTNSKEKYRCILPLVLDSSHSREYAAFSSAKLELELLKTLFDQTSCTYRLETYWTYEMCHGRHVRQYHEEKESGKKPALQEYFLGRYKMETFQEDLEQAKQKRDKAPGGNAKARHTVKKVQGVELPYYEVKYDDGTKCDLTGQPRKSAIHYVCQPDGRGEIYELKEVSSCEYEIVVLSSQLCLHPTYGPKKDPVNMINCHSLDGSPRRPLNLDIFDLQNSRGRYNSKKFLEDESVQDETQLLHNLWDIFQHLVGDEGDEAEDEEGSPSPVVDSPAEVEKPKFAQSPPSNKQILDDFLKGDYCIEGGTGWWKHEFCFGKHVQQHHVEKNSRVTILLGVWDKNDHLLWLQNNPTKRPKPLNGRKSIILYYGSGSLCEETGKKRFVEVRLKCADDPSRSNAIALYLLEPNICEYKLVVEAPVLCDLVQQADDNGLIENSEL